MLRVEELSLFVFTVMFGLVFLLGLLLLLAIQLIPVMAGTSYFSHFPFSRSKPRLRLLVFAFNELFVFLLFIIILVSGFTF